MTFSPKQPLPEDPWKISELRNLMLRLGANDADYNRLRECRQTTIRISKGRPVEIDVMHIPVVKSK